MLGNRKNVAQMLIYPLSYYVINNMHIYLYLSYQAMVEEPSS